MVKNLFLNLSKALVLVGFTMSLLHLFGCSFFQTTPEQEVDLNKVASDIVQAFEKNNIDPIENLLSQSALDTEDLRKGLRYSNEVLKDEKVIDIEEKNTVEGNQYIDGKSNKYFNCNYYVRTEQNTYRLSFQFFTKNTIYPQDQGIYRIYFSNENDYSDEIERFNEGKTSPVGDLHWNYGATYERAGIYNPEWQTTPPPEGYTTQRY